MIEGTDIAPLLTCIPEFEKHFQKCHRCPKTTRHRFDPNKHKGVEAGKALVNALKRECHFSSCFHLSTERTETNNNRLPHNWLCHVKLHCTHSRLSQASEKEFEDGKSSQSGTRQQLVKQSKKKKPRLPNYRCWHGAPLQDNRRCGFYMKIFCYVDECWHLQTQKSSNTPPMRHCHHRQHDPILIPTSEDLWTDDMIEDAKAAIDVSIETADVANLINKKHGMNCSHAQILKMKWHTLAKKTLKVEANSTERLQHLMDNRQTPFVLIHLF